jgi:hypothetical protein
MSLPTQLPIDSPPLGYRPQSIDITGGVAAIASPEDVIISKLIQVDANRSSPPKNHCLCCSYKFKQPNFVPLLVLVYLSNS